MLRSFRSLAPEPGNQWERLEINGRYLSSRWVADDVVWFDFQVLCNTHRAASDYIEIALQFHTLCLSHIPVMSEEQDDVAKRP